MARCALRVDEVEVGVATAIATVPGGKSSSVIGVTRDEINQLLDDYRLDHLVESDASDGSSSESPDTDSGDEDADRAPVVVEAADTGRPVEEEGNVAENADTELERAEGFTCGCSLFEDGACCRQFSFAEIANSRIYMRDMSQGMCD